MLARCRLARATIPSTSTIADVQCTVQCHRPRASFRAHDFHELARSKVRLLFPWIFCFILIQSSFSVLYWHLQYRPKHAPRLQRALRSFLIAGAAFVASSYAATIYCPHHSTHAIEHIPNTTRRPQHRQQPRQPLSTMHAAFVASPRVLTIFSAVPPLPWRALRTRRAPPAARAEPAAVVPHRARHTRRPPIRCDRLQRRPTVCSKPGPVAQREYDAHHHQRTQYTLQRLPIICATLVPSPRAPTICSVDLPSPLDSPACAYFGTVPSTTYVRRIRREYSPSPTLR
ncbi:hypothetical protein B0H14DRAFT_149374 [Mycena olivaceomarginata]|nr:hypothetical protein B0H14DRAFT_149374 [Mycena olivaceomarginata]